MATSSSSHKVGFTLAFIVWAVIVMAAGFAGAYVGYGGRRFALALTVAAAAFAFELFLALPDVQARAHGTLGNGTALAVLFPLAAVLGYALLVSGDWKTAAGDVVAVVRKQLYVRLKPRNR